MQSAYAARRVGLFALVCALGCALGGVSRAYAEPGTRAARTVEDRSALRFADPAMADAAVRKLELANGVRVYLLHDPGAKTDAVACAVRVGSWQDPADAAGMAHFVEHLLFMGSVDYPDENEFYAYLARHGGNTNAYTTVDRTVYMFDVEQGGLAGSLRRFGGFFKNPLLRDASIARERLAVDQEFRSKERVDGWREVMVDAALSVSDHPNHRAHIGSEESLAGVNHAAMAAWFEAHYSAHLLDLVVRGPQSLDTLQAAVVAGFAAVPRRGIEAQRLAGPVADPAYNHATVVMEPLRAGTRELSVKWDLPLDATDKQAFGACELVAYLLAGQGKNALPARLSDLGLAEDVDMTTRHFATGRTWVTVSFDLTDRGVTRRDEVLSLLFAALREYDDWSRLQPLVRELRDQTWRQYAWQSSGSGYDAVAKTADAMVTEALETFPEVSATDVSVTPAALHALLVQLRPDTARATLVAPYALVGVSPQAQRITRRMGVGYVVLPHSISESLANVEAGFGIPTANPWMPQTSRPQPVRADVPGLKSPLHLVDDAYADIFVARDTVRNDPRISLTVDVKTPLAQPADARDEALYDLWWQAVRDRLRDLRNEADAAGVTLQVEPCDGGVRILLSGLTDKAPKLLDVVLRRLARLDTHVTAQRFETLKVRLDRIYEDQKTARPRDLAYAALTDWRYQKTFAGPEKRAALAALQAGDLAYEASRMFAQTYTQASFYGNIDLRTAYACYASINKYLRHQTPHSKSRCAAHTLRDMTTLKEPVDLFMQGAHGRGNAVVVLLDEGPDWPEAKAASAVLGQAIESHFFDELRTRQQVAYSLSTSGYSRAGHLFRSFAVSPFHLGSREAANRIDAFLRQYAAGLTPDAASKAAFAAYKAAVRKQWAAEPDRVASGNERLHWLAFDRHGDFSLINRRIEALDRLDFATFAAYARRALGTPHRVQARVDSDD